MKCSLFKIVLCLLMFSLIACAQQPPREPEQALGNIRLVTLYRDRALVTREIIIPAGDPLRSIDVPDLPELVVPDSVFADGNEQTVVRAVRVSPRPASPPQRDEVRALDEQISKLTRQREEVQQMLQVVSRDIESLDELVSFSSAAGKSDLNRGVLNAETLTELSTFSMQKHRELANEKFEYEKQLKVLDGQLQRAQWSHSQATSGQQSANYQAKIFVETPDGDAGTVRLSYLVGGCGWSPQYTVRGRIGEPEFELRYSALVQQMSGEDWEGISLILSTASPSVSAPDRV